MREARHDPFSHDPFSHDPFSHDPFSHDPFSHAKYDIEMMCVEGKAFVTAKRVASFLAKPSNKPLNRMAIYMDNTHPAL